MKKVEKDLQEKWALFKEQLDDALDLLGQFSTTPHALLSIGEAYTFENRRNYCLDLEPSFAFCLSYPMEQLGEKESRLISMSIRKEWERKTGYLEHSKDVIFQKALLGILGEKEIKWLKQMGYSEKESYLPMVFLFHNPISADDVRIVEEGLTSFFGFPVPLIRSAENYVCFLPTSRIQMDEGSDIPNWKELGQGIFELFEAEFNLETRISVAFPVEGFSSWGPGFRKASKALRVGMLMYPEMRIFFAWDLDIEMFLHFIPKGTAQPFVASVWENWGQENLNPEWVKLIRTLIQENLNISETARKMYVHRNTLMYRMEKFKSETGRDLRLMEDVIQVYLATLLTLLDNSAQKRDL
ncbi:PucR family transcriptional regulator [Ammoniphilus sp. 3BR4]|uniref:PucR family transcriptional regulator n=1 Tax=Ammoniphilus sp. 3BR4 TaxID=3158265 RepID=UPI003466BAD6